jgi:glutathione S-transferase
MALAMFFCQHFEDILAHNGATTDAPGFLVGKALTVADLAGYHFLAAAEQHFKEWYDPLEAPLCRAFKASIEQRPRIQAYLSSERCQAWDKDSMM